MRHVSRIHRVDLDWLFEVFRDDPGIFIKFVKTHEQLADMLTKGSSTQEKWLQLCNLNGIGVLATPVGDQKNVVSPLTSISLKSTLCWNRPPPGLELHGTMSDLVDKSVDTPVKSVETSVDNPDNEATTCHGEDSGGQSPEGVDPKLVTLRASTSSPTLPTPLNPLAKRTLKGSQKDALCPKHLPQVLPAKHSPSRSTISWRSFYEAAKTVGTTV